MVAVRTTTAEAALSASERASRIVLAKVDVEGAELHALRSLLSMMPKIDNIVIETSPGWWTERHNQARAQPSSLFIRAMLVNTSDATRVTRCILAEPRGGR